MAKILSRDIVEAVEQLTPYFLAKMRQSIVGADILPDAMGEHNLGSSTRYFNTVYAQNIKADTIHAARAFLEGVGVNLLKNGSFEQVAKDFTNQPEHWVLSNEGALSEEIGKE